MDVLVSLFLLSLLTASTLAVFSNSSSSSSATAAVASHEANVVDDLSKCAYEEAIEYYGKSFVNLNFDNAGKCCAACREEKRCNLWTYVKPYAKRMAGSCWLFEHSNKIESARKHGDMVSGLRVNEASKTKIKFESGVAWTERTLSKQYQNTKEDCVAMCAKSLLCKAVSYHIGLQQCYTKRSAGGTTKMNRMVSAVVRTTQTEGFREDVLT